MVSSPLLFVALRDPDQLDAFSKGIERLADGAPAGFVQSRALQTPKVERAIRAQATAVRIVAVLTLLAHDPGGRPGARAPGLRRRRGDDRVLRSLGMRARRAARRSSSRAGLVLGVVAALVAVAVAILMSPLMPVGLARIAELHRGFDVDPLILGLGALAVVIVGRWLCASSRRGACAAARDVATRPTARRWRDGCSAGSRLSPSVDMGVRFALERGRGERSTGGVDDRARRHADHRAARRAVVVPGEPAAHARLAAPLRLELEREERRARAARRRRRARARVLARSGDLGAFAAGTITQAELGLERVDVMGMQQQQGPRRADGDRGSAAPDARTR